MTRTGVRRHGAYLLFGAFFLLIPVFSAFAEDVATSSAADPSLQEPKAELSGSVPTEPAPMESASAATSAPAGGVLPRSAPVSQPSVKPSIPQEEVVSEESVSETSTEPAQNSTFAYIIGAVLVAMLGALGIFKGFSQSTKGKTDTGDCEEIKRQLEAKRAEKVSLEAQIAGQESAVELAERKLKEKAEEKIDEKKGALLKKTKEEVKNKLFGKEGKTREGVEGVESLYATYKDLEQKLEQAKKLLALLRSKREGVSKEVQTLESSYAVCVSVFSSAGIVKGGVGKLELPYLSGVKVIIFDWGGVISSEVLWNWLKKNIPNLESKKDYFQNLIDAENKGGNPDGLVAMLAKETDKAAEMVAIELNLEQVVHADMVLLIRALKKKYKIGLLSNANSHLREVISKNNLDDLFDHILISAEHNLIKPDPAIFKKMLNMFGVKPEEAVFVDDRKKNTDAASALGMQAILFTSHDSLVDAFKKLGISSHE